MVAGRQVATGEAVGACRIDVLTEQQVAHLPALIARAIEPGLNTRSRACRGDHDTGLRIRHDARDPGKMTGVGRRISGDSDHARVEATQHGGDEVQPLRAEQERALARFGEFQQPDRHRPGSGVEVGVTPRLLTAAGTKKGNRWMFAPDNCMPAQDVDEDLRMARRHRKWKSPYIDQAAEMSSQLAQLL